MLHAPQTAPNPRTLCYLCSLPQRRRGGQGLTSRVPSSWRAVCRAHRWAMHSCTDRVAVCMPGLSMGLQASSPTSRPCHLLSSLQKWVGTTECAALLRSFGVRAQIVDFGVDAAQAAAAAAAAAAAGGGRSGAGGSTRAAVGVHSNVECDGCGQRPIRGVRYTSQALPDYDLCGTCRGKPGAAAAGPFREMLPTAMAVPHPPRLQQQQQDGGSKGGSLHDQLLAWVWRYFMTDDDAQPSSRSGGSGEDGTAAGCAATGGSAVGGGNGVQPAAKRLCLQPSPVRMSGKSPLYFQVCYHLLHCPMCG